MAKRNDDGRIEPSFGEPAPAQAAGLSLSEEDRVMPPARRRARQPDRPPRGRRSRKPPGRGLFRSFGRLFYWLVVLAIWGGIGLAGLVIYYGAQMPSATTWAIPDRPPNVQHRLRRRPADRQSRHDRRRGLRLQRDVALHPEAVMAIEDRRFYPHFGVDPIGLVARDGLQPYRAAVSRKAARR